jgi:ornithine carbamoyltransferase
MKAFNDLSDYSIEEIKELLELSGRLEKKPEPNALVGRVLSLLFLSPSLRTLTGTCKRPQETTVKVRQ